VGDAEQTAVERPKEAPPTSTIVTPEQAARAVEAHRMRDFMIGTAAISLVAAIVVMMLGGDPFAAKVHAIVLALSALTSGGYAALFGTAQRFRPNLAAGLILSQVIVMLTGYYFWGAFSAYAAVIPLSIYIAASVATPRQVLWGSLFGISAQALFGLAIVMRWIEPRGLVDVVRGGMVAEVVGLVLIQAMSIAAAIGGRDARRQMHHILDEHHLALRDLAKRDAQLAEAQAEAIASRKAGGGGIGRFTDQQIDGFHLGEILGRGSMGEVYAAMRGEERCAIKLLAPHLLRNAAAFDRFQRESAMLVALRSPHVVRTLGVSRSDAAMPYLAMERLEGKDLAELAKEGAMRERSAVVDVVKQIAAGLDAAHAAGVIHRDLKLQNIFGVGPDTARTWKLLDFGASKWADGEGSLTKDNIVGTPGYMSPEQALGEKIDARSDIYALGVIAYRLITGVPPVVPGEIPSMLHEVVYRMPPQPSRLTEVSSQIEAVLAIAMAKSPSDRFASAGEFATALEAAVEDRLPREIAQRAAKILTRTPWGGWLQRKGG
jgi:serine/threonine-protein kinase